MRNCLMVLCLLAVTALLCQTGMAAQVQADSSNGFGYGYAYGCRGMSVYAAPACFTPGYGYSGPGCCPCPASSCCDHIWDGYCQERGCFHGKRCCGSPYQGQAVTVYTTPKGSCSAGQTRPMRVEPQQQVPSQPAPRPAPESTKLK